MNFWVATSGVGELVTVDGARGRRDRDSGLIIFSDAHFSVFWDHVARACGDSANVINPNRELADFVSRMMARAPVPVVNLGDAVEYAFDGYDRGEPNVDNRAAFYRAIAPIADRYHEVIGNHDTRQAPYNLRAWGLDHININRARLIGLRDRIGRHRLRPPNQELRAIAPVATNREAPQVFRGPTEPVYKQLGGLDCVFLNTHGDGFLSPAGLGRMALSATAGALRGRRANLSIQGYGLKPSDLAQLADLETGGDGPLLHFMHNPLVNSSDDLRGQAIPLSLTAFDRRRRRHGLDHHAMARGGAGFLSQLRTKALGRDGAPPRSMVVLAGHTHTARYFLIEAESLVLRQVGRAAFNRAWHDPGVIKHATVLPLGVIDAFETRPRLGYAEVGQAGITEVVTGVFDAVESEGAIRRRTSREIMDRAIPVAHESRSPA